ncbi:hypothetical protein JK2ML_2252 [Mycobacterium leprae Kyoto-2]|uniref:Uncharacterized protein n=3 Tax=Mycobacterium leprae TaxID=1769 RepID=Q7APX0_MYCLE|nr:hypothetical protein [Mycobacterium leprae]CAR72350.1 hypothetical protein MLBr02252 [Mycobacterium leprae Br4923]AAA63115.1 u296t [Mycobacterium leprae]AWV48555.1 hypothetical protein DIJ64_12350 [Mycobacterium leprae]OAR20325.1 hypothetical protein A8144_11260 [Mycobacterium leprae 3125609]OAX70664.1 hypothetical protein A3216_10710 [Mycobacterium leprae 7935681]
MTRAVSAWVAKRVNFASHRKEGRTIASVHDRYDMERMAIRVVADTLGNTIPETGYERLCRSDIDNDGSAVASEQILPN